MTQSYFNCAIQHFTSGVSGRDLAKGLGDATAALLIIASLFKTLSLNDSINYVSLATASIEFSLAGWLITRRYQKFSGLAAIMMFILFTLVSIYSLLEKRPCGCFGDVELSPWIHIILDGVLLVSHASLYRNWVACPAREWRFVMYMATAICVLSGGVVWSGLHLHFSTGSLASQINGAGVDRWVGLPFPLLDQTDVRSQLGTGRWLAILYHHDCQSCSRLIRHIPTDASPRIALLSLPPHSELATERSAKTTAIGRINHHSEIHIPTPTIVLLFDGFVQDIISPASTEDLFRLCSD